MNIFYLKKRKSVQSQYI